MSRARTLTEWIDEVAHRADVVVSSTGRHTPDTVGRDVNQAIQAFMRMMSTAGDDRFLRIQETHTVAEGASGIPDTLDLNQFVFLPPGFDWDSGNVRDAPEFYAIRGIDVFDQGVWRELVDLEELNRNLFEGRFGGTKGAPIFFRIGSSLELDLGEGVTLTLPVARIFPWADAEYPIKIWYIPQHEDLSEDSETFDAFGFEDWIVNDAALRVLIRDGLGGTRPADDLRGWQQQLTREMRQQMASRGRAVPRRRIDTRQRRERLLRIARSLWGTV